MSLTGTPIGPLYHSGPGGFAQIAHTLGNTIVTQHRFDAQDWLRLVETHSVTTTFTAPTPIRMVCSLPADVKERYDRSSMRRCVANAALWTLALKQRYMDDFPAGSLWEVTGPHVPGELYVRSASMFDAYYKADDKYEADRREDYHTVGDIGYRDEDGYFYIADRKSDMIISGGMNIYPAEIEAVLDESPDIFEAAVFGVPDEDWGQRVHAVVVAARPGLTAAEVIDVARSGVAAYKLPRSVSFVDELPKTGSGKVLKRELRNSYLPVPAQAPAEARG